VIHVPAFAGAGTRHHVCIHLVGSQGVAVDDVREMDDFQVIAERQRVMANLAALTDRYKELNQEITKRGTLKWMLVPR
jgi:hypothetical protein